jgi:hypothetical protein
VPVTGLAENFSPIPRIAPPPFGSSIAGGVGAAAFDVPLDPLSAALAVAVDALGAAGAVTGDEVFVFSRSVGNGFYLDHWGERVAGRH